MSKMIATPLEQQCANVVFKQYKALSNASEWMTKMFVHEDSEMHITLAVVHDPEAPECFSKADDDIALAVRWDIVRAIAADWVQREQDEAAYHLGHIDRRDCGPSCGRCGFVLVDDDLDDYDEEAPMCIGCKNGEGEPE
jgi:hypothetical protein